MKNKMFHKLGQVLAVIILIFMLFMSLFMFAQALIYDNSCNWGSGELHDIAIEGEYREESGSWYPLTSETKFDYKELRDITVRGHFTRDLPEGDRLFLKIEQLWVNLKVNGEDVIRFGPVKGDGNPAQSIGNLWFTLLSPGITTEDMIELNFGNLYRNAYYIQFEELLWDMRTGCERALLSAALTENAGLLLIGVIFLFLTLFLIITAVLCVFLRITGAGQMLLLGICAMFSSVWFLTLAPAFSLIIPKPVMLNTLYAYSIQGIAVTAVLFLAVNLSGWRRQALLLSIGMILVMLMHAIGIHMSGRRDLFSTIDYFSLLDSCIAVFSVFCLCYEIWVLKNQELRGLLYAMFPLAVLGILEMANGYFQFSEAAVCFGSGIISFTILEGVFVLRRIRKSMEREKEVLKLENEVARSHIAVMLSQIQPHFLYNSLLGIKQLCKTRPRIAADALDHFSHYLRGNLDSLSGTRLITFEKELDHLENFLYLEKMRFEDRVNIQYEVRYKNFMLPPLILQPLVENAVRYGITKKEEGGTVTIRSVFEHGTVIITIMDDGVGFDMKGLKKDDRSHIGIENVKKRIEMQCGGSLNIQSTVGIGTSVTLSLPQGKDVP